ncbi:MAG: hypothetical protein J6I84_03430 [Bacilli bacterium]|nr:hypothetical protein [Bacilli bacterium]
MERSIYPRYSRILIPLPPIESIIYRVQEILPIDPIPEYIQLPELEGYAISWPTWYGYGQISLEKAAAVRSFFKNNLDIEDSGIIEWYDENHWDYLSNNEEAFSVRYENSDGYLGVYKDFLRFHTYYGEKDVPYESFTPDFVDLSPLIKKFRIELEKVCRRGFFNRSGCKYRETLYQALNSLSEKKHN